MSSPFEFPDHIKVIRTFSGFSYKDLSGRAMALIKHNPEAWIESTKTWDGAKEKHHLAVVCYKKSSKK